MQCPSECYHITVKYCNKCLAVHCENCGFTWKTERQQLYPAVNVPNIWYATKDSTDYKITCTDDMTDFNKPKYTNEGILKAR